MLVKCLICLVVLFGVSTGNSLQHEYDEINSYANFANNLKNATEKIDNGVSLQCRLRLVHYSKALLDKEIWALKMFDATAKIPSGIAEGNFVDLGFFDECLSVQGNTILSRDISGQYCVGTIPLTNASNLQIDLLKSRSAIADVFNAKPRMVSVTAQPGFHFGICLPDACSATELINVFNGIGFNMVFYDELCQTKATQPKLNGGAIATLSFFGIVLWLMLASTIYDAIIQSLDKKPFNRILLAFSILTNGRKITTISKNKDKISCLHGIRVLSTMWVILAHRYSIHVSFPVRNYIDLYHWMKNPANMFILETLLAVDTFLLMSGLVLSYCYLIYTSNGAKFNFIMMYVHRYLRLTPVLAVILLIHVIILPHLGSGPLWPNINFNLLVGCTSYWWKTLLYVQNYGQDSICVPQSWYLSVDTQLFVLSPLLLVPLRKWPKNTLAVTIFLAVCSSLTAFLMGWFYELRWNILGNLGMEPMFHYTHRYYFATETRAGPWLIGIILGYIIFKIKQRQGRLQLNKIIMLLLWAASLAILVSCLFGGHDLIFGTYYRFANSIHMALVRPAWAISVGYVIFACVTGYGGLINWFLSLPIFQILSKFTYTLYLVHYLSIYVIAASMRTPPEFSNAHMVYLFWSDFMVNLFFSVIFTLAFECPIITLENAVFGNKKPRKIERESSRHIAKPTEPTETA